MNLTVDQFAEEIRKRGNNSVTYQHLNNHQLTEEWLKKYPGDNRYLSPDWKRTINVPSPIKTSINTASNNSRPIADPKQDKWKLNDTSFIPTRTGENPFIAQLEGIVTMGVGATKEQFMGLEPSVKSTLNLMFNPQNATAEAVAQVNQLQEQLKDPNITERRKEYIRAAMLPAALKRVDRYMQEFKDSEGKSLRRIIYEDYTLPVAEAAMEDYGDKLEVFLRENPEYVRIKKWREGETINSFTDLINPTLWGVTFAEMAPSMIASRGTGATLRAASGLGKLTKGKKLSKAADVIDNANRYIDPVMGTGMLVLMENSDVQQHSYQYLKNEFEWVDADGNKQIGLSTEDALQISALAGMSYAFISGIIERSQMNRMGDYLGVTKNARRSLLHNLATKLYTTLPRTKTGKIVYEGFDMFGNMAQEMHVEGMQAYFSEVAIGAVENGYDINQGPGLRAFLEDAGIEAQEIGLLSLVAPYASDNPNIAQASRSGFMATGIPSAVSSVRHRTGFRLDKQTAKFKAARKDGEDVVATPLDGGVILHNTNTDESVVIPTGNELESDYVIDQFNEDIASSGNTVKIKKSINTAEDYLHSIINNVLDRPGYTNNEIISNDKALWNNDNQLNKIQKQFKKDAKANRGAEAEDWQKVINLIKITGDKNILNKVIHSGEYDNAEKARLAVLQSIVIDDIKASSVKNLKQHIVKSNQVSEIDAQSQLEELLASKDFLNDDQILESFAAGANVLNQVIANQINKNDYEGINIAFNEDFFQDFNPKEVTQQDITNSLIEGREQEIQSSIDNLNNQNNEVNKIKSIVTNNRISNFKSKNLSGRALYGYAGAVYLDALEANNNPIQDVKMALEDKFNATNLGRLAKELGIKVAKDIGTPKGKKRMISQIANKIQENVQGVSIDEGVPAPSVPASFQVETPSTPMEKDIIQEDKADNEYAQKASLISQAKNIIKDNKIKRFDELVIRDKVGWKKNKAGKFRVGDLTIEQAQAYLNSIKEIAGVEEVPKKPKETKVEKKVEKTPAKKPVSEEVQMDLFAEEATPDDFQNNEPSAEDVQEFFRQQQPELDIESKDIIESENIAFDINDKKVDDLADGLEDDIECG